MSAAWSARTLVPAKARKTAPKAAPRPKRTKKRSQMREGIAPRIAVGGHAYNDTKYKFCIKQGIKKAKKQEKRAFFIVRMIPAVVKYNRK